MKINIEEVMAAVEEDNNIGFCTACGERQEGVEPDAERYECEACGENRVYGAEQIILCFA